jgi:hypothetical protein
VVGLKIFYWTLKMLLVIISQRPTGPPFIYTWKDVVGNPGDGREYQGDLLHRLHRIHSLHHIHSLHRDIFPGYLVYGTLL